MGPAQAREQLASRRWLRQTQRTSRDHRGQGHYDVCRGVRGERGECYRWAGVNKYETDDCKPALSPASSRSVLLWPHQPRTLFCFLDTIQHPGIPTGARGYSYSGAVQGLSRRNGDRVRQQPNLHVVAACHLSVPMTTHSIRDEGD